MWLYLRYLINILQAVDEGVICEQLTYASSELLKLLNQSTLKRRWKW